MVLDLYFELLAVQLDTVIQQHFVVAVAAAAVAAAVVELTEMPLHQ